MQGNKKVIDELNARLADELTAINQYMVHAEMCDNWGYEQLHEEIQKRAIEEMKHAEKLIARILFLEGRPVVSKLNQINIGPDVEKMHKSDWKAEEIAIKGYNDSIRVAVERGRQRDARDLRIDSDRRRRPHRLDRGPAEPDRADGHSELSRRADRLMEDRDSGLVARASRPCVSRASCPRFEGKMPAPRAAPPVDDRRLRAHAVTAARPD